MIDLLVIGAGLAGLVQRCAATAAEAGLRGQGGEQGPERPALERRDV